MNLSDPGYGVRYLGVSEWLIGRNQDIIGDYVPLERKD
jgi:hypothetical protein